MHAYFFASANLSLVPAAARLFPVSTPPIDAMKSLMFPDAIAAARFELSESAAASDTFGIGRWCKDGIPSGRGRLVVEQGC
jgi:hypothetical protein